MNGRRRRAAMLPVVLAGAVAASTAAGAGELYKCTVGGHVVYQQTPCPRGTGGVVELGPVNSLSGTRAAAKSDVTKAGQPGIAAPASRAYESAVWYSDYAGYTTALRESESTGAPLLVYFYTDWCPYCKQFSGKVLPDSAVVQRLRRFVKVRVNTERGAREGDLFRSVGGKGIPFVIVQPARGSAARVNAAADPQAFVQVLDRQLQPAR